MRLSLNLIFKVSWGRSAASTKLDNKFSEMKLTLISLVIFILFFGCGQESQNIEKQQLSNIEYTPRGGITVGTLDSTEYHNSYFGFSIKHPEDAWIILNSEQFDRRASENKEIMNATDQVWEEMINNNKNLITFEESEQDMESYIAQSISFMAEGLDLLSKKENVNTALDYLKYCEMYYKKHYSSSYPRYTVTGSGKSFVGNKMFLTQSITVQEDHVNKYYQKTYTAQFGKYLLNIITVYETEEELIEIKEFLESVKWN